MNNGLEELADNYNKMTKEALTNKDFKKLIDNFMSKNKKITKMTVVLKNDMNNVLGRDLNRATVVVLIGVFLVLVIVTRSLWEPAVITASLIGSYYAAIFIINFIFINLAGYEGISSFVPFFAFIIVIALGVDYSIFLMMRFKEYTEISHKEAIVLASEHIGSVVMSAAIILGGTFATLAPSGLILLIELAVAVITGLIVLCFIMLPAFLPAMISLPSALEKIFSKNKEKLKQI